MGISWGFPFLWKYPQKMNVFFHGKSQSKIWMMVPWGTLDLRVTHGHYMENCGFSGILRDSTIGGMFNWMFIGQFFEIAPFP